VCNARGVNDTAIAEWNLAMMINLSRNLNQMVRNQQAHIWDRASVFQTEIRGATVGIWGYGGIGRQTARLCKALDMRVFALTRSGAAPSRNVYCVTSAGDPEGKLPDRVFTSTERMDFLRSLDFLILCLPLDATTNGIVGEAELRALPRTCFLLNPARGALIEQAALLRALSEGWIAGAAIDTHYEYPLPATHPLWESENVILTPHISGSTASPFFKTRLADLFIQNIDRYRDGRPLFNQLADEKL
jgi:phosphoglycerate dehydrogenase-like enzyme